MEKIAWDGPKWGREVLLAITDLVDILGDMDLDFENIHFQSFLGPNFWITRFPDFQNLVRAGLGPGQA